MLFTFDRKNLLKFSPQEIQELATTLENSLNFYNHKSGWIPITYATGSAGINTIHRLEQLGLVRIDPHNNSLSVTFYPMIPPEGFDLRTAYTQALREDFAQAITNENKFRKVDELQDRQLELLQLQIANFPQMQRDSKAARASARIANGIAIFAIIVSVLGIGVSILIANL